jgi:very-short-patch-repair endonuclease
VTVVPSDVDIDWSYPDGAEVRKSALSLGERVVRRRRFSAGARRVRGYFRRQAKLLCPAKPSRSQPGQTRKDATKEDYLRTLGISLLRVPNGLVLEDPEEFVRKVREAVAVRKEQMTPI